MHVELGRRETRTYPGLAPDAATGQTPTTVGHTPDFCHTSATCDTIPLTLGRATDVTPYDDYRLRVELHFRTERRASFIPGQQPVQSPQLNLYIWSVPAGDRPLASASASQQPQVLTIDRPSAGAYSLVVQNTDGVNDNYTLVVSNVFVRGGPPVEVLDDGGSPTGGETGSFDPGATGGAADVAESPFAPGDAQVSLGGGGGLGDPLSPVPTLGDVVASDLSGLNAGDDVLAARRDAIFKQGRRPGPARPPSAAAVALWLGCVPTALGLAAAFTALRRRPVALTMANRGGAVA